MVVKESEKWCFEGRQDWLVVIGERVASNLLQLNGATEGKTVEMEHRFDNYGDKALNYNQ